MNLNCVVCSEEIEPDQCLCIGNVFCSKPCMIKYLEKKVDKIRVKLSELQNSILFCDYCCCRPGMTNACHDHGYIFCSNECLNKYNKKIEQLKNL